MKDCLQCAGLDLRFQATRFSKLRPGRIIITITGITCNNDNNNNNNNDNNNNKTATDIDKRVSIYLVNKYVPTNALKM